MEQAELSKVRAHHPNVGLVLRIRADDVAARCNLGDKYGAEEDEWEPLLRAAAEQGLRVVGISFHVGSGAKNPQAFPIAVRKAREAFDMAIRLGHKPYLLDLGGGYSGNLTEGITMQAVRTALLSTALPAPVLLVPRWPAAQDAEQQPVALEMGPVWSPSAHFPYPAFSLAGISLRWPPR